MRFFGLARPCECERSTIGLFEVTAADRAAATVQHTQYPQKASPERGGARRAGGGVRPPSAACPRRLCQPPWTRTACKEPRTPSQAEPTQQKHPPQTPAALRERGVWGERGFSQRSRLSPQNLPFPPFFPSQLTTEINSALIVLGCTCRCSSLASCQGLRRRGRGKHQCARDRDAPPRPTPSAPAADGDPA